MRCSQMPCSGSGVDASRSGIAVPATSLRGAAVSHRHRRSRSCLHRACAVPMCYTRCCLTAASARPQRAPCVPCGAARCPVVALVLMQADRVSPARTRTAAESTTGPVAAAVSHRHRRSRSCLHRACAVPMCYTRCCLTAASARPQRGADRRCATRAAVSQQHRHRHSARRACHAVQPDALQWLWC